MYSSLVISMLWLLDVGVWNFLLNKNWHPLNELLKIGLFYIHIFPYAGQNLAPYLWTVKLDLFLTIQLIWISGCTFMYSSVIFSDFAAYLCIFGYSCRYLAILVGNILESRTTRTTGKALWRHFLRKCIMILKETTRNYVQTWRKTETKNERKTQLFILRMRAVQNV
jgi:hypothetical protein